MARIVRTAHCIEIAALYIAEFIVNLLIRNCSARERIVVVTVYALEKDGSAVNEELIAKISFQRRQNEKQENDK